jgi:hypothetical protein
MGILILTTILLVTGLAALMFLRGGAREPVTVTGPAPPVPSRRTMEDRAVQLIGAMGLSIERRDGDERSGPGFVAVRNSDDRPERVYVQIFELPSGERVREPDVIAALDVARSEGFNKTLLLSANGFTDEAVLAAEGSIAELIDAAQLDQRLRATLNF